LELSSVVLSLSAIVGDTTQPHDGEARYAGSMLNTRLARSVYVIAVLAAVVVAFVHDAASAMVTAALSSARASRLDITSIRNPCRSNPASRASRRAARITPLV